METQEKYRLKSLLRKSRIASHKKYLSKVERGEIVAGYQALKTLGIFGDPKGEGQLIRCSCVKDKGR